MAGINPGDSSSAGREMSFEKNRLELCEVLLKNIS
jgi:hypothetical protein